MQENNATATIEQTDSSAAKHAGKYLSFSLAAEEYGLDIMKVREIIKMMRMTSVPGTPDYVKGVINLRGKVIPVIDLRLKLDMPEIEYSKLTAIIVVQVSDTEVGLIVDRVIEVMDISAAQIEEAPSFGSGLGTDLILGLSKANEKVTILLDINKVVELDELSVINT